MGGIPLAASECENMALTQNQSVRDGNVARLVSLSTVGAGISGAMGVGFGAFAAHGLASLGDPAIVEWVKTGASYQLWHAAALLGLACLAGRLSTGLLRAVAVCFFLGALLFGSSLYVLALLHWSWVVFVTPIGGMLMLIGWVLLIIGGWRHGKRRA
jgi:uncharacterized membrane protein YgdD (TMEM256/DUF423 family)